jgi:hypothetical protein
MKKINTIKYICDTSIEDMIQKVKNDNNNVLSVIQNIQAARTEFGLKVQDLIKSLTPMVSEIKSGMTLQAKEDCLNNFEKGQNVQVGKQTETGFNIDGCVDLEIEVIHKNFSIYSFN